MKQSPAGMRFIAQMSIYNRGDFSRLRQYFSENYHSTLLDEQSPAARTALLKAQFRLVGRLRVRQVIVAEKYEVVVLVESERDERLFIMTMSIEEEYPHHVVVFEQG